MSLELVREIVKVNQIIGTDSSQAIIDNDIIVPDTKPDIARILILDGDANVVGTDVMQDKVMVDGMISIKILYISDDSENSIKSINSNVPFNQALQIPNARGGMNCRVKCDIEHLSYDILNGRKINIKIIVKLDGKLSQEVEQPIISGIKDIENVQVLQDNIKMNSYVGDNNTNFTVAEALEVPAGKPSIREILRTDIKISGKDYKITDNKVAAKGELNVSTLYIGDNEESGIEAMEHEIPFTQFIDLPGINEDSSCELEYKLGNYELMPVEDNDGEQRVLNAQIEINAYAKGTNSNNIDVVSDAYIPGSKLNIEKEPFTVEETVAENRGQIILKDTLIISDDCPEINQVFNVLCKPGLTDIRVMDDRVVLEGVVSNNVLYLANNNEQPVFCFGQEIPFRHGVDIKGIKQGMKCEPEISVEHCSYSMVSSSEVEVRLVIGLTLRVSNDMQIQLISRIEDIGPDEDKINGRPSLIIYYAKHGDTLWKIAKNYTTTIEFIENANNLNVHNALAPGQQIIIPKSGSM